MTIVQQGALNTTALIVPDIYVQIVPPQVMLLNGVPSNVLGIVGTAAWGPVNSPTSVGSMAGYAQTFGTVLPRPYDLGTAVAVAVQQGASNMLCVRVTDGTDMAATVTIQTALLLTARYTGSLGNNLQATLSPGTQANSWRLTIALPGLTPEVFDNLGSGLAGVALWTAIAAAVNSGNGSLRGPSGLVAASAIGGTAAPAAAAYPLAGGSDGAAITSAQLIGQDTLPRKGMYALRSSGASVAMLADLADNTTWSAQVAFGLAEGIYMVMTGPAGDSITNAVATKSVAGIDSYAAKLLLGDWVYWLDSVNGVTRLISPQAFVAGCLANSAPQQSSLNKPLYGIVATQKTAQNQTYSSADLQQLAQAGIDVITNPVPGGSYFGARIGHNTSSNAVTNGDNYTRMTNYLAKTFDAGMGKYVGRTQSANPQDPTRAEAQATLDHFLSNMYGQGQIADWLVVCNLSDNPASRIALGYLQANVQVTYLSVVEKFLVNLEGGQSVAITRLSTVPSN